MALGKAIFSFRAGVPTWESGMGRRGYPFPVHPRWQGQRPPMASRPAAGHVFHNSLLHFSLQSSSRLWEACRTDR